MQNSANVFESYCQNNEDRVVRLRFAEQGKNPNDLLRKRHHISNSSHALQVFEKIRFVERYQRRWSEKSPFVVGNSTRKR